MSFESNLIKIYQKEKHEYAKKIMHEQDTLHPEYEFETFEEWKKERCISKGATQCLMK